jgi:broad specificity phosphatase PhoE
MCSSCLHVELSAADAAAAAAAAAAAGVGKQLVGFQEEVQLREQDWGNFQAPGQQTRNYEERLKYGRFFFRFPEGESAADVYDRMTM